MNDEKWCYMPRRIHWGYRARVWGGAYYGAYMGTAI